MKIIFLFLSLFISSLAETKLHTYEALEQPLRPEGKLEDLESLNYLINLIKEKQFNVTFIVSKIEEKYGEIQKTAIGITSPLSQLRRTKGVLNQEIGEAFLKKATADKLAARVFLSKENEENEGWTNNPEGVPNTKIYNVYGQIHNGSTGFTWDDKNFVSHYTFIVPGGSTTKTVFGDLDIQVVKTENLKDEEVTEIKRLLAAAYFPYLTDEFLQALVALLTSSFPDDKWEVVIDADKNNYVKAKKLALLKFNKKNYLIFST